MRILEQEEVFVRYFGNDVMGRYFTSPNGISSIQFLDRMRYSLGGWNSMQEWHGFGFQLELLYMKGK
jgi:hypothetical protein